MSNEILGHDVNGEALRAGDRITVIHAPDSAKVGAEYMVVGPTEDGLPGFSVDMRSDAPGFRYQKVAPRHFPWIRKSSPGRDIFDQARDRALSQGSPDAQHEWTEPTTSKWAQAVLSGMPWTEPGR